MISEYIPILHLWVLVPNYQSELQHQDQDHHHLVALLLGTILLAYTLPPSLCNEKNENMMICNTITLNHTEINSLKLPTYKTLVRSGCDYNVTFFSS